MNKLSLFVRKVTVPPMFAAILLVLMYLVQPAYFGSVWQLSVGLFCLAVLPVLGYPLQKYIPKFLDKGREGQRTLAMIFSFVGYLIGTIVALICHTPTELKVIYFEYLLCGIAILVFNKVFKMKVSGHACGIVGPVLLLVYFKQYIAAIVGALLIVPVYISSLRTKRHTAGQLIGGTVLPVAVLCLIAVIL